MKRKALFVGIDNYTRGIPALSCARNDANALLEYFLEHGYAEDDVSILRDGRTSEILDELDEQTKRLKPGDLFLFFFAGHGYTIEKSDGSFDRCLAGADDRCDRIMRGKEGISLSEIKDRADKARCPFVVILDACQTKIDTNRAADNSRKDVCNQRDLLAISSVVNRKSTGGQTLPFVVINSCDVGEVAYELEEKEQGLFTFSMLETLKQVDNPVFDKRLLALISSRMGEHGGGYSQHPRLMLAGASDILDVPIFPDADSSHEAFVVCPVCGKKNYPENTFKCRKCGRDNLCLRHQDETTLLCAECTTALRKAEAERRAREEADRAFEEAKRRAREEAERAFEEAKRRAREEEEAKRRAREEVERRAREECEAREAGERKAREEAKGKTREEEVVPEAVVQTRAHGLYRFSLFVCLFGSAKEQFEKGEDFFYGRNGVIQDEMKAIKWYRKAAERGYADAQFRLGMIYQERSV